MSILFQIVIAIASLHLAAKPVHWDRLGAVHHAFISVPPHPMDTPIRKTVAVTHHVDAHLYDAFQENARDFFARASSGTTPQQRAAEIPAKDRDHALDSLVALVKLAQGDTGQYRTVGHFLAIYTTALTSPSISRNCGSWTRTSSSVAWRCCD